MFDETHDTEAGTWPGTGTPRRSAPGQLRLQLPQQSAPVERGRRPQGGTSGGAAASGILSWLGQGLDDVFPF